MQFWAVCFVGLYVGVQLFNWVTGLHWLADFSLPLSILGGLGLAIASAPATHTNQSASATSDRMPAPQTDPQSEPQPSEKPASPAPEASISFTIHKNVRP